MGAPNNQFRKSKNYLLNFVVVTQTRMTPNVQDAQLRSFFSKKLKNPAYAVGQSEIKCVLVHGRNSKPTIDNMRNPDAPNTMQQSKQYVFLRDSASQKVKNGLSANKIMMTVFGIHEI